MQTKNLKLQLFKDWIHNKKWYKTINDNFEIIDEKIGSGSEVSTTLGCMQAQVFDVTDKDAPVILANFSVPLPIIVEEYNSDLQVTTPLCWRGSFQNNKEYEVRLYVDNYNWPHYCDKAYVTLVQTSGTGIKSTDTTINVNSESNTLPISRLNTPVNAFICITFHKGGGDIS